MTKNNTGASNSYVVIAIVAIVAIIGAMFIARHEDKPSTKLGRAVEDLGEGVEDAADEMKPNRTPVEKVGDAIEDVGDDIKDSAN